MDAMLEQSYRDCVALARRSGSNFYCSFLTLPRPMFRDMCVLYAFMRQTDDLGDAAGMDRAGRHRALADWRAALDMALEGHFAERAAAGSLLPAVAQIVRQHQIPHQLLFDVIRGVERDIDPESFATFEDLQGYCYQVAGVVGECCIRIWGCSGAQASSRAIACGTAFQLTNILRDLAEDAERGRCYLPREDLARFGYSWEDLQSHRIHGGFRDLMRFEVERAASFYDQGSQLLENLAPPGQRILRAMLATYRGLLDEIQRRDYDVFRERVSLPGWRRWLIVGQSFLPSALNPALSRRPEAS